MSEEAPPPAASDEAPPQAASPEASTDQDKGEAALRAPEAASPGAASAEAPSAQAASPEAPLTGSASPSPAPYRPNFTFLAIVSVISLALDLSTKVWAKRTLELEDLPCHTKPAIVIIKDHFGFIFACNRGGAWGLLQNEPESIRRPFFLGISIAAIIFIVSLYRKLTPQQWALKWGLPLVLGGALGNLVNRIQYNYVVDFIDVSGDLIRKLNKLFGSSTNHWPTFNVADIAIVVGVGLMAIDMFTPRKAAETVVVPKPEARSEAKPETRPETRPEEDAKGDGAPPASSAAEPKET